MFPIAKYNCQMRFVYISDCVYGNIRSIFVTIKCAVVQLKLITIYSIVYWPSRLTFDLVRNP